MSHFPTAIAAPETLLNRLRHLITIQAQHQGEMNRAGIRLVRHSLMAAVGDCTEAGLGAEAAEILQGAIQ